MGGVDVHRDDLLHGSDGTFDESVSGWVVEARADLLDLAHGAQLLEQQGIKVASVVSDDGFRNSVAADDILEDEFGGGQRCGIRNCACDSEFGEVVDGDEEVLVSTWCELEWTGCVNSNEHPRRSYVDRLERCLRGDVGWLFCLAEVARFAVLTEICSDG